MKKILNLFSVLLIVSLVLVLTSCKKKGFDYSKGELVVGMECDYSPFNWTETTKTDSNVEISGQIGLYAEGYDVQIAKLIAEDLGLKLVIKKMSWDGLIPALNSGEIDAIIAGMSPTEERKVSISFTEAYYNSEHVVVVKANGAYANATRFADFKNANIVGQKGTAYATLAAQLAEKAGTKEMTPLDTVPLIVSGILLGNTDVTVVEKPVALNVCATNPELKWIKLADNFEVSAAETMVSIGIRKIDTKLLADVNAALAKISQETRDQLMLNAVQK